MNIEEHVTAALQAQNLRLHIVASGAGSRLQHALWSTPGASAWLSGASFPYDTQETDDLLGFTPERYCDRDAAIHLACAAYMKAFRFGKRAVGLGLSASISSARQRRGDHRVHAAVITPDSCHVAHLVLEKGEGKVDRDSDDVTCTGVGLWLLAAALGLDFTKLEHDPLTKRIDADELLSLVMKRPMFTSSGRRSSGSLPPRTALMPGAYNPPHEGHFGVAELVESMSGLRVVHQVTIDAPHKPRITAQGVLERARMLVGHDVLFTMGDHLYLDKAEMYPGVPLILGADALERMLDPKWGHGAEDVVKRLQKTNTKLFVSDRPFNGSVITANSACSNAGLMTMPESFISVPGNWNISSSDKRAELAPVQASA